MKVKLSSVDILEIAKALKCGWLDMGKIASFKSLLDGYNPPKRTSKRQLDYYKECLYNGIGYIPTDEAVVIQKLEEELPTNLKEKWRENIYDGSIYKGLVKDAFWGMVAMVALGGTFTLKDEDYSFCKEIPDFEL